jgi:uncharacterized protein (DUF1697 family)
MPTAKKPSKPSGAVAPYIALLRAINVGGRNALPMKDLAAMMTALGCSDVATYIQSGNVVFQAPASLAETLPQALAAAILKQCGFEVPIVLRSAAAWTAAIAANPYLTSGADLDTLHVAFLASSPEAKAVALLDPKRSPPDTFQVRGQELYLCCPEGYGKTKLTNAYFDSKLKTVSTVRNWRTVLKLQAMAAP